MKSELGQFSSTDNVSLMDKFKAGVNPEARMSSIPAQWKSSYTVEFKEMVQQVPNSPKTGTYLISIQNIPKINTLESIGGPLYYSDVPSPSSQVPVSLVGAAHPAGKIPLLILVRVDNQQHNGDIHWGFIQKEISATENDPIQIRLQDLQYFKVQDPQGGPQ